MYHYIHLIDVSLMNKRIEILLAYILSFELITVTCLINEFFQNMEL